MVSITSMLRSGNNAAYTNSYFEQQGPKVGVNVPPVSAVNKSQPSSTILGRGTLTPGMLLETKDRTAATFIPQDQMSQLNLKKTAENLVELPFSNLKNVPGIRQAEKVATPNLANALTDAYFAGKSEAQHHRRSPVLLSSQTMEALYSPAVQKALAEAAAKQAQMQAQAPIPAGHPYLGNAGRA